MLVGSTETGRKRSVRISKFFIKMWIFLIVGGLYSVTALRAIDQERVTVYTKHRLRRCVGVIEAACVGFIEAAFGHSLGPGRLRGIAITEER